MMRPKSGAGLSPKLRGRKQRGGGAWRAEGAGRGRATRDGARWEVSWNMASWELCRRNGKSWGREIQHPTSGPIGPVHSRAAAGASGGCKVPHRDERFDRDCPATGAFSTSPRPRSGAAIRPPAPPGIPWSQDTSVARGAARALFVSAPSTSETAQLRILAASSGGLLLDVVVLTASPFNADGAHIRGSSWAACHGGIQLARGSCSALTFNLSAAFLAAAQEALVSRHQRDIGLAGTNGSLRSQGNGATGRGEPSRGTVSSGSHCIVRGAYWWHRISHGAHTEPGTTRCGRPLRQPRRPT